MNTYIKLIGKTKKSIEEPWKNIICFIGFSNAEVHRQIIEDSFQYHLNLNLEYMKKHHSEHFSLPHNVGRAIVLYNYFRERHQYFEDSQHKIIAKEQLPNRNPDVATKTFEFWIEAFEQ
ncbi:MAG: hypothetical protein KAS05_02890 [Candidatus Omnitrophica bacterium]|nr:hypothetical protein [Candidatus Omnitrophota bacterium]